MPSEPQLYFNGINGETGEYLAPPIALGQAVAYARGKKPEKSVLSWLRGVVNRLTQPFFGLPSGVDPADVRQAGWGIVFHQEEDEAVKQALAPLVERRRQQIGDDSRMKVLEYRDGESLKDWLGRNGTAPGSIQPWAVPYYLLLVGSPRRIPFLFGHLLDVEYAVGRLDFAEPAQYAAYAASLIDYETGAALPNRKEAVFFATRHLFDKATQISHDRLVVPLVNGIPAGNGRPAQVGVCEPAGYAARTVWAKDATRAALEGILAPPAAEKPPAFLFTASHGMGGFSDPVMQRRSNGALLCQDWPGFGSMTSEHYLAAADLPNKARVHGLVAFHFACYGGGTPSHDRYLHDPGEPPPKITAEPFLAALPKALLTHPGGGALACIGHVERAWGYSIETVEAGAQIQPFQNAVLAILAGQPVGHALKDFGDRYAVLSTNLTSVLEDLEYGAQVDEAQLATQWIERNDAEGYVVIGDPAARIRVENL